MPNELAKNVGRLDVFGLNDYAKRRRDAMRAEASNSAQVLAERKAAEGEAYLKQKLDEAQAPTNANANERRALMEENRRKQADMYRQARQRAILNKFGEKEE